MYCNLTFPAYSYNRSEEFSEWLSFGFLHHALALPEVTLFLQLPQINNLSLWHVFFHCIAWIPFKHPGNRGRMFLRLWNKQIPVQSKGPKGTQHFNNCCENLEKYMIEPLVTVNCILLCSVSLRATLVEWHRCHVTSEITIQILHVEMSGLRRWNCIVSAVTSLQCGWSGVWSSGRSGNISVFQYVQTSSPAHPIHWVLSLGVKQLGCEIGHWAPCNAEIRNKWSYTPPPICLHSMDSDSV